MFGMYITNNGRWERHRSFLFSVPIPKRISKWRWLSQGRGLLLTTPAAAWNEESDARRENASNPKTSWSGHLTCPFIHQLLYIGVSECIEDALKMTRETNEDVLAQLIAHASSAPRPARRPLPNITDNNINTSQTKHIKRPRCNVTVLTPQSRNEPFPRSRPSTRRQDDPTQTVPPPPPHRRPATAAPPTTSSTTIPPASLTTRLRRWRDPCRDKSAVSMASTSYHSPSTCPPPPPRAAPHPPPWTVRALLPAARTAHAHALRRLIWQRLTPHIVPVRKRRGRGVS